uniref:Ig-like domain-containing protein n=1 Tax=Anas zonorhyncha TaxID=75864 RepID=A0A8B9UWE2_9AVES
MVLRVLFTVSFPGWSIAASDPAESVAAEGAQPSWRFESTCGSLPCPSQAVSCLAAEMTELWAEEGSSVTMHAPAIRNINLAEWEYIRENIPELILQYHAESQSVTIYPAYKGRVDFYENNGSLVLQKLQETDSGIYRATVNLLQDKATSTTLRVIEPLPQPKLLSSSNLDGSLINLTCVLPEGTVADVSWKKDGHPLPPEKCFQLTGKNTVLQIRKAEKSVCGSYSCIINNTISLKEAALNLTMTERGCSEAVNLTIGFVIPFSRSCDKRQCASDSLRDAQGGVRGRRVPPPEHGGCSSALLLTQEMRAGAQLATNLSSSEPTE